MSFENIAGLDKPYLLGFELAIQSAIFASVAQCFYAWRIYTLSGSLIFPAIIVACVGGIAEGFACFVYGTTSATVPFESRVVAIWIAGSAACDITITIFMVVFVTNRRSGMLRTDNMVNKLIQVIVETGLATASLVIVQLCMYLIFLDTTYFLTPESVPPKAYSNSLFVLLNNRNVMHKQADGTITIPSSNNQSSSQGRHPIQVNIAHDSYIDHPLIAIVHLPDKDLPKLNNKDYRMAK